MLVEFSFVLIVATNSLATKNCPAQISRAVKMSSADVVVQLLVLFWQRRETKKLKARSRVIC